MLEKAEQAFDRGLTLAAHIREETANLDAEQIAMLRICADAPATIALSIQRTLAVHADASVLGVAAAVLHLIGH